MKDHDRFITSDPSVVQPIQETSCDVFQVYRMTDLSDKEEAKKIPSLTTDLKNNNVFKAKEMENGDNSDHEKLERRDSGFHTMTRFGNNSNPANGNISNSNTAAISSSSPATLSSSTNNNILNVDIPAKLQREFSIQRERASPIMTRRHAWMKQSNSNELKAEQLAQKLFRSEGEEKKDVAQHLSQKGEFGVMVAKKYMELFNFTNVSLDESLRLLLKKLALVGETQERERVLYQFSSHYKHCNPRFLEGDIDVIHTLVCATALLNTDLHGARAGGRNRMTFKQFSNNLSGLGAQSQNFPSNLLKEIYRSIKKKPLPWCGVESSKTSASTKSASSLLKSSSIRVPASPVVSAKSTSVLRSQSMNHENPYKIQRLPLFQEDMRGLRADSGRSSKSKTLPRKQGVLWRKSIIDSEGNRISKRKRRWKLVVVALQGLEFHLAKKDSADANKISVHHCLAEVETSNQATKRQNVFRLTLANRSVCLFQTSSKEEVKQWVRSINRNAALLSAAPLSAGIGSQLKFQRPLLPSASSTLPLTKQLEEQENRLESLCTELDDHEKTRPAAGATASEKAYFSDKEAYLQHEVQKYEAYTNSLSELLSASRRQQEELKKIERPGCSEAVSDNRSLLSVSPSEPGAASFTNLSSCSTMEKSDSTNDLLNSNGLLPQRPYNNKASSLSPTASMPNLHPLFAQGFPQLNPTPLGKQIKEQSKESISNNSHSFETTPSVTETDAGNISVRLIPRSQSGSSTSSTSLNCNNSNMSALNNSVSSSSSNTSLTLPLDSAGASVIVSRPINISTGFATTGRLERTHQNIRQSNTISRVEGNRSRPTASSPGGVHSSPVVVSTSYLSNTISSISENPTTSDRQNTDKIKERPSSHKTPPRVRGRKERRGASRYSYMQAVYDPTKL